MRIIDADALVWVLKHSKTYYKVIALDVVLDAVRCSPTIDAVEVVRGEWIEYRPPTESYCGMVECPFCGEELVGEPTDFNYCPNCGARMKGADNE